MCEELEEPYRELRTFSSLFFSEFTEFWIPTELLRARSPPSTGIPPPPGASTAADSCVKSARAKQGRAEVRRASKIKTGSARLRHFCNLIEYIVCYVGVM